MGLDQVEWHNISVKKWQKLLSSVQTELELLLGVKEATQNIKIAGVLGGLNVKSKNCSSIVVSRITS